MISRKFFRNCFLAILMCAGIAANAQTFVVERGNSFFSFDNLEAAMEALQNGDKIYIPPGTHGTSGDFLTFDKSVTIIGAGYEGADASRFNQYVYLEADGITVTGIAFTQSLTINSLSNLLMTRCLVISSFYVIDTQNNIVISECEFRGGFGSPAYGIPNQPLRNAIISKSIFKGNVYADYSTIYNCLFLTTSAAGINSLQTTFQNNIIVLSTQGNTLQPYFSNTFHATFDNNLWLGGEPTFPAANNVIFNPSNITGVFYADTFNNPTANDYSLKEGSVGIGAGNDGTDVGIFGTAVPFKASKLPAMPHFSLKNISPETDETGNLKVNIVIEAQER